MSVTVNKATLQVASGPPAAVITINKATLQVVSGPPDGGITINKATLQVASGPVWYRQRPILRSYTR